MALFLLPLLIPLLAADRDERPVHLGVEMLLRQVTDVSELPHRGVGLCIRPIYSSKNIDVEHGSTVPCAKLHLWDNHSGANQRFSFIPCSNGCFKIVCMKSGLVLDVTGSNYRNETRIIQFANTNNANQRFKIYKFMNRDEYVIKPRDAIGYAIDIHGRGNNNGTAVQLYESNGTPAQRFVFYARAEQAQRSVSIIRPGNEEYIFFEMLICFWWGSDVAGAAQAIQMLDYVANHSGFANAQQMGVMFGATWALSYRQFLATLANDYFQRMFYEMFSLGHPVVCFTFLLQIGRIVLCRAEDFINSNTPDEPHFDVFCLWFNLFVNALTFVFEQMTAIALLISPVLFAALEAGELEMVGVKNGVQIWMRRGFSDALKRQIQRELRAFMRAIRDFIQLIERIVHFFHGQGHRLHDICPRGRAPPRIEGRSRR